MTILTSHTGNLKRCKAMGFETAVISRINYFTDRNFYHNVIEELAPYSYALELPRQEYLQEYRKVMNRVNQKQLLEKLERLASGKTIVLLSTEPDANKCHRRYLAQFLEKITGQPVNELEESKVNQKTMF